MSEKELLPNPKCLVLFSGGKDSFISACTVIEKGYDVVLISFNNGAVAGEETLMHGVTRLQNRYGKHAVTYAGIYCTSATISCLTDPYAYTTSLELGTRYPNLIPAQLTCLHCQTAMWAAAIAYACAKDIKAIATGYRSSDVFCTGHEEWVNIMSGVAESKGIAVLRPVWNKPDWDDTAGWERDQEMISRSFEPQVLEPQCLLGRPVKPMTAMEKSDMLRYFNDKVEGLFVKEIETLTPILGMIRLSSRSFDALHYDPPTGEHGIF